MQFKLVFIHTITPLLTCFFIRGFSLLPETNRAVTQRLTVKQLIQGIEHHNFDEIYFSNNQVFTKNAEMSDEDGNPVVYTTDISPVITTRLVDLSLKQNLDPIFLPPVMPQPPAPDLLTMAVGLLIVGGILRNFFTIFSSFLNGNRKSKSSVVDRRSQQQQSMSNTFSFFRSNEVPKYNFNVTFKDWAGSKEVLEECSEIVTYFKNNASYVAAGATIPKGILMEGPPGTGKTLLAKAIACESDAQFIEMSGSEFIEMFVGVGAMRVRKLFEDARNNAPCVIFIDEIDAVGKQRSSGDNGGFSGNDEKDQTLNQLLSEMDGFKNNEGIIVLAATNRKDMLDKALLRPGRFDRIITIPLPDMSSRKQILDLYLNQRQVNETLRSTISQTLAKMTSGFSGADIKNLVNEAAIILARNNQTVLQTSTLLEAFEKRILGVKKTVDNRSYDVRRRVAIHEMGHAFIAHYFSEYFDLQKVSIQASYSGAGGFTLFSEKEELKEGGLYTKDVLMKRVMVALGGKAAEELFYGEDFVSVGATRDLEQANDMASRMIEQFGMGSVLNVFYKNQGNSPFTKYSEYTKQLIDQEVANVVNEAYHKTFLILKENYKLIDTISGFLMDSVTITGDEFLAFADSLDIPLSREISNYDGTDLNEDCDQECQLYTPEDLQ
jgi:cell division protease FtsH